MRQLQTLAPSETYRRDQQRALERERDQAHEHWQDARTAAVRARRGYTIALGRSAAELAAALEQYRGAQRDAAACERMFQHALRRLRRWHGHANPN